MYEEEVKTENKATRVTAYDITNYRTCPEQYILKLKELRYSENTIKSYKGLFEEFINYYPKYDIKSIDEKMIIAFMQYLVIERKFPHHIRINLLRQIHFTVKKNTSDFATIFQGV